MCSIIIYDYLFPIFIVVESTITYCNDTIGDSNLGQAGAKFESILTYRSDSVGSTVVSNTLGDNYRPGVFVEVIIG